MKNKNEVRDQILLKLVAKSNQVIDEIGKLTIQIYLTQPDPNMYLQEKSLFTSQHSAPKAKN